MRVRNWGLALQTPSSPPPDCVDLDVRNWVMLFFFYLKEYSLLVMVALLPVSLWTPVVWICFAELPVYFTRAVRPNPEKVKAGPVAPSFITSQISCTKALSCWFGCLVSFSKMFFSKMLNSSSLSPLLLLWCQFSFLKALLSPHSFNNVFIFTGLWVFGVPCELYSLAQTGWRKRRPGNPSNLQLTCGSLSLCDYCDCCLVEQWAISWVLTPLLALPCNLITIRFPET